MGLEAGKGGERVIVLEVVWISDWGLVFDKR